MNSPWDTEHTLVICSTGICLSLLVYNSNGPTHWRNLQLLLNVSKVSDSPRNPDFDEFCK